MNSSKISMRRLLTYISILSGVLLYSCKDDDFDIPGMNAGGDNVIRIGANVLGAESTRSYIESGEVSAGNFTLTYPYYYTTYNTAYGWWRHYYQFADVSFRSLGDQAIGFPNMGTDAAPKELVWAPSSSGANNGVWIRGGTYETEATMFLDNIPRNFSSGTATSLPSIADTTINFKAGNNPYIAGIFDDKDGTNDLLWGKVSASKNTPVVHIDLHHIMSMLTFKVVVDESDEHTLGLDLSNASLKITNVILQTDTFKRTTGELLYNHLREGSDLNIVNNEAIEVDGEQQKIRPWANIDDTYVPQQDPNEEETPQENDYTEYTTQTFVVPPQSLATDLTRPKLVIKVPRNDVNKGIGLPEKQDSVEFSGYIPRSMFIADENQGKVPLILNFISGYSLTITTLMKPGTPELEFMPVTVEPWVFKGSFAPKANQAGIGNAAEFYEMIRYYKQANAFRLGKYGYILADGSTWNFQFRAGNVELQLDSIQGQMIPNQPVAGNTELTTPPFQIDFRNRIETLVLPDGTKWDMPRVNKSDSLYTIVTTPPHVGVKSAVGFDYLIEAYQKNTWRQNIYGGWNSENSEWQFKIAESMTLDYNDIVTQMIPGNKFGLKNFSFVYDSGVVVTVENYPSAGGSQTVTPDVLKTIVSSEENGIYTSQDFQNLISGYPSDASSFGTQTSGSWVFPIWRSITLQESTLQGKMQTGDFSFNLGKNKVTLTRYDGTTTTLTGPQLVRILKLPLLTGVTTAANNSFSKLIEAYTSTSYQDLLPQFGYYDNSSKLWVISINSDLTLEMADIKDMMPVGGGKDYIFNLGTYTITINDGADVITLINSEGETQLKEITSGQE